MLLCLSCFLCLTTFSFSVSVFVPFIQSRALAQSPSFPLPHSLALFVPLLPSSPFLSQLPSFCLSPPTPSFLSPCLSVSPNLHFPFSARVFLFVLTYPFLSQLLSFCPSLPTLSFLSSSPSHFPHLPFSFSAHLCLSLPTYIFLYQLVKTERQGGINTR